MRRFLLIAATCAIVACRSRTEYGDCVGVIDDAKDPNLIYKMSVRNVVIGSLFFGTLFTPAIVLATQFQCPVAHR